MFVVPFVSVYAYKYTFFTGLHLLLTLVLIFFLSFCLLTAATFILWLFVGHCLWLLQLHSLADLTPGCILKLIHKGPPPAGPGLESDA